MAPSSPVRAIRRRVSGDSALRLRHGAESVFIPLFALGVSAVLFSLFLVALGKSPVEFFALIWRGGFGTFFSWQNTLPAPRR